MYLFMGERIAPSRHLSAAKIDPASTPGARNRGRTATTRVESPAGAAQALLRRGFWEMPHRGRFPALASGQNVMHDIASIRVTGPSPVPIDNGRV